jgi:hypothetical protein
VTRFNPANGILLTLKGSQIIAGGKRSERAAPGQTLETIPTLKGSRLNVECATPSGSEIILGIFPGAVPPAIMFIPSGDKHGFSIH